MSIAPWNVFITDVKQRWSRPYAGNYLPGTMALYCPSQNPPNAYEWPNGSNTVWITMGIVCNGSSGTWLGSLWTDWTVMTANYADRWINLEKCPDPGRFPLLADTIMNSGSRPQYAFWEPKNTYQNINVHTRHNNGANFGFADGHVQRTGEKDLKGTLDITRYCTAGYQTAIIP